MVKTLWILVKLRMVTKQPIYGTLILSMTVCIVQFFHVTYVIE